MIDLLGEGVRAVGARSAAAYPLVFCAGVVTSIGPCAAPRYVAIAALAQSAQRPAHVVLAFVAGVVGAYAVIGYAAGALAALAVASSAIYAALAIVLAAGGIATLLRAGGDEHARDACGHRRSASHGGAFLLGAASALVVSPCCTPIAAAIAGLTVGGGRSGEGVALLGTFACGHVVPVVMAGLLGTRASALLRRVAASQAPAIVSAGLMLALAAYYGVLA